MREAVAMLFFALAVGCGGEGTGTAGSPTPATAAPTPSLVPGRAEVDVFFARQQASDFYCQEVFAVPRPVDLADPLGGALAELVAGPTPQERADGYDSWFSQETAALLRSARLEEGTATVDFGDLRPVIPNASTSCGADSLLGQLDSTVMQFPDVTDVVYSIDGDAPAFYEWLQRSVPDRPPPRVEIPALLGGGRHAVYLLAIDTTAPTLTVDPIQFLTGDAAVAAYRRDHPTEQDGPPNDYYVVDASVLVGTFPVAADVAVRLVRLSEDGDADLDPGSWAELPDYLARYRPGDGRRLSWNPFWITLRAGRITEIEEQYTP